TLKKQIIHYTRQLFIDDAFHTWEHAHERIEELYQKYRENNVFINQVNLPAYLSSLTKKAMQAPPNHLVRVWKSIGPYLLPKPPCLSLFAQSIEIYGTLRQSRQDRSNLARDLFMAIHKAIQKDKQAWLELLVNGSAQKLVAIEPEYLKLFYCL